MKTTFSSRITALMLSVLLVFGLAVRASAQTVNASGLLDDAYATLEHADHDYKGHRAKAMEQIKLALKELGTTVSGKGKGREPQATSDAQLKAALDLLTQVKANVSGKVLKHVSDAIAQLNTALSIK